MHAASAGDDSSKDSTFTWLHIHPAAAVEVGEIVTGDDVVGPAKYDLALVGRLPLAHGYEDIGAAAEVHQSVLILQVGAEQVGDHL